MPAGLGLAPLLELLSATGSFEGLEEVRTLVESTRNLRLPLLDELLGHLTRIKVVRLAARLAGELELPTATTMQPILFGRSTSNPIEAGPANRLNARSRQ